MVKIRFRRSRQKYGSLPDDVRWHMIGHLQRNKVHQVLGKAVLIHSVDSLRLARQIEEEAAKKNMEVDILLEINVAKEESKYGFLWKMPRRPYGRSAPSLMCISAD